MSHHYHSIKSSFSSHYDSYCEYCMATDTNDKRLSYECIESPERKELIKRIVKNDPLSFYKVDRIRLLVEYMNPFLGIREKNGFRMNGDMAYIWSYSEPKLDKFEEFRRVRKMDQLILPVTECSFYFASKNDERRARAYLTYKGVLKPGDFVRFDTSKGTYKWRKVIDIKGDQVYGQCASEPKNSKLAFNSSDNHISGIIDYVPAEKVYS